MSGILTYVASIFNWLFVSMDSTATPAAPAAIKQVITLVTGNGYLMVGLSLMLAGSAIAFLRRLIRSA